MKKLYEESELKRLTTSEIDRMKDDTVFIQISETKFEGKLYRLAPNPELVINNIWLTPYII